MGKHHINDLVGIANMKSLDPYYKRIARRNLAYARKLQFINGKTLTAKDIETAHKRFTDFVDTTVQWWNDTILANEIIFDNSKSKRKMTT